jgi:hypothetical protein
VVFSKHDAVFIGDDDSSTYWCTVLQALAFAETPYESILTEYDKYVLAFNDTRFLSMKLDATIAVSWYVLCVVG